MKDATTARLFLTLDALAVMLGAFGAHALRARLAPDMLAIYQTAVQHQLWHVLVLIGIRARGMVKPPGYLTNQ